MKICAMILRPDISIRGRVFSEAEISSFKTKLDSLPVKDVYRDTVKVGTIDNIFFDFPNRICVNFDVIDPSSWSHTEGVEIEVSGSNIVGIKIVDTIDLGLLDEGASGTKVGMVNWVEVGDT